MKICLSALLALAAVAIAFPIEDQYDAPELASISAIRQHHRERRFTCDFLSGFGVSHSACAAHCIGRGRTGGSCTSRGICQCRKETIKQKFKRKN